MCVCVSMTVVFDVMRLLAGVVRRHAVQLHPHQRVHDGFIFVLVDFGQLLRRDHLQRRTAAVLERSVRVHASGNTLKRSDTTQTPLKGTAENEPFIQR